MSRYGRYVVDESGQAWVLPFDGGEAFEVDRDLEFEATCEAVAERREEENE